MSARNVSKKIVHCFWISQDALTWLVLLPRLVLPRTFRKNPARNFGTGTVQEGHPGARVCMCAQTHHSYLLYGGRSDVAGGHWQGEETLGVNARVERHSCVVCGTTTIPSTSVCVHVCMCMFVYVCVYECACECICMGKE